MAALQVALVAADREVWSGEADMVIARTTDGDVGILPGHAPLFGVLGAGSVQVRRSGEGPLSAVVDGGFLSVADNVVSILAEQAQLPEEIDVGQAQEELRRAEAEGDTARAARARARVNAAGAGRH